MKSLMHKTRPWEPIWMSFWSFFSLGFPIQRLYRPPMFLSSVMSHRHLASLWDKDYLVLRTKKNDYSASFFCYSPRRDQLHTGDLGETAIVSTNHWALRDLQPWRIIMYWGIHVVLSPGNLCDHTNRWQTAAAGIHSKLM